MNLLSSLRYLVALHEHRHFGRAALACHVTQPALSNGIKALEAEFGVVIVRRGRNFAGFTPEGERVLASAQFMLREQASLRHELHGADQEPRGPVRLGAVPTAIPIASHFAAMLHARHGGIQPVVLSLSSRDLERGLENLTLDLALGYAQRLPANARKLQVLPQYTERYFLLRRCAGKTGFRIGAPMRWADAAALPLCLLTPDMHNRTIVDAAFREAGTPVQPALETNSILTMMLAVQQGSVASVLPGALVATLRGQYALEALPLVQPDVRTQIAFLSHAEARPARALEAARALAQDAQWLRHVVAHSGALEPDGPQQGSGAAGR